MKSGWNEIDLNGARQWVSLRGDPDAPTLLFLHGGPGSAEYGPRRHYLGALEDQWRVADWDQRGAGRSFHGDETAETLSLDSLVSDGLALADRLRSESSGRPLVLAGHSFGTVLGVLMASRAPNRFAAYVGASQVVDWALQEQRSYDWVLAEARRRGHPKAIHALVGIGPPLRGRYVGGPQAVQVQRRWLGSFGGVSGDPRFLLRWMLTIMTRRDYPTGTKLRFLKGMARSMELMWSELGERIEFSRDVTALELPVHLFAGDRDRITDLPQVKAWYGILRAPSKRLEVVEGVGHLNLFEAPARFVEFMAGVRSLVAG